MNDPAHPLSDSSENETNDEKVYDSKGREIRYQPHPLAAVSPAPVPAPVPAPRPYEEDDMGRRVTNMGGGGARATRGMDPHAIVRDHWSKGVADDEKWMQLYTACIMRRGDVAEIDLELCADEADCAYFQWWQRREAARTTT